MLKNDTVIHPKVFYSNISGTLFSVVSLFLAEFKSISVVCMCEWSRGMFCDDSTMSCDDSVINKLDIFRLTPFKM